MRVFHYRLQGISSSTVNMLQFKITVMIARSSFTIIFATLSCSQHIPFGKVFMNSRPFLKLIKIEKLCQRDIKLIPFFSSLPHFCAYRRRSDFSDSYPQYPHHLLQSRPSYHCGASRFVLGQAHK